MRISGAYRIGPPQYTLHYQPRSTVGGEPIKGISGILTTANAHTPAMLSAKASGSYAVLTVLYFERRLDPYVGVEA